MTWLENLISGGSMSQLLRSAFDDISRMLEQGERMLELALAALLDNEPLDEDLDRLDDVVDHGEQMVRRSVLEHLSVQPKQDLVPSLVLVSMVQDCERIGDFARGLGELVALTGGRREGAFRDRLKVASARLLPLFEQTRRAFLKDDRELAQSVVEEAAEVKAEYQQILVDVAKSDLAADQAVVYSSAARILGRVASHLSNVCSTVVQPYDRIRHEDESV